MTVVSYSLLTFVFCFLVIISSQINAQQNFLYNFCIDTQGNYTVNSTYQHNLNTLLSNLSSNTETNHGFYNFSYGQNSDKVNAIGLCRGDVKPNECLSCLNNSRVLLQQRCPNQKEAIEWYDNCMLRYSNRSIFGLMEASPSFYMWNLSNATDVDRFNQVLRKLLESLRDKAASGDSRLKFGVANAEGPSFQTIYGLVQCTPDLSEQDCYNCLNGAISEIPSCCNNKRGGRVIKPSCNFRYESYRFYDLAAEASPPSPQPMPPPPSPSNNNTSSQGNSNTARTAAIAIAVPMAVALVVSTFICIYLRVRKLRQFVANENEEEDEIKTRESLQFLFDTIRVATDDFSDSDKLGEGGFGAVYRGTLSNGQEIAVKRLSRESGQGNVEFKNEVLLVAKLQHRNLVRLLGFSLEGSEKLLVYEFVPNKSLDYFIFDPIKKVQLDWEKRYKIIVGIARGLVYLHEDSRLRIIHRDLKPSNILLDEEMNPKISDFGMARLFGVDQTQGNTSRVVGTYGYMAPEYAMHGQFSVKSDVFSFGVLVLEIVSGQKNSGIRHGENVEDLMNFAWRNWRGRTATNIIDPSLNNGSQNEMMRCIHIGLLCVQENVGDRPTMATIALMLNSHSLTLPVPSEPAFFMDSRTGLFPNIRSWDESNSTASESPIKSAKESVNEASITELYPR